jgi:hypothetical protein
VEDYVAAQFRTIEIDFDVHRCIENERHGFDDPPNSALRRLLKLRDLPATVPEPMPALSQGRSWNDKGVTLPRGTAIRMHYNGQVYEGLILDGQWVVGGKAFESPSGAASAIAITKKGKTTRLDGWIYWQARRPNDDEWVPINSLRPSREVALDHLI